MERLDPRPIFISEKWQARNAEEALLVVLNACGRVTKTLSRIEASFSKTQRSFSDDFGYWISRLCEQREFWYEIPLQCLSFLNLPGCNLRFKDLLLADLEGTNLEKAILWETNLRMANLKGANLEGTLLEGANLEGTLLDDEVLASLKVSSDANKPQLLSD